MNIVLKAAQQSSPTGTIYALAKLLNISPQAVYLWEKQGYVPVRKVSEVSQISGIPQIELFSAIPQEVANETP